VPAEVLRNLATTDGNTILLTLHASSNQFAQQIFFPGDKQNLPDHFSRAMFDMSSPLTANMLKTAEELLNVKLDDQARGIVYNADIAGIVQALEIGTRPANLT
jgi:hypothetical protein